MRMDLVVYFMRVLSIVGVCIGWFNVYCCCLSNMFVVCRVRVLFCCLYLSQWVLFFMVGCDAVVCVYDVVGGFLGNTL